MLVSKICTDCSHDNGR